MTKHHPARTAGLASVAGTLVPTAAHAATLNEITNSHFVAGFATGIVVTAACAASLSMWATHRSRGAASTISEMLEDQKQVQSYGKSQEAATFKAPSVPQAHALDTKRPRTGSHMASSQTGSIKVQQLRDALTAVPDPQPHHVATDLEDIATNYAATKSFAARMSARAAGVAETLRSRLGAGHMDGVPVIERADGSVGDVGTSWWTATVGQENIDKNSGFGAEVEDVAIPETYTAAWASQTEADLLEGRSFATRTTDPEATIFAEHRESYENAEQRALKLPQVLQEHEAIEHLELESAQDLLAIASAAKQEGSESASVREVLATHTAPTQEGLESESVSADDLWQQALDAMEARHPVQDPDQTNFMLFRTPAGHPEVVDPDSYVDYLIQDEFAKIDSRSVRRTSRRYLRMIKGGEAWEDITIEDSQPIYVGKHFKQLLTPVDVQVG